jgi:hypothetical protein
MLALAVLAGLLMTAYPAVAADLDASSQPGAPSTYDPSIRDIECYAFGGTGQSYTGEQRGRGNTYTVWEDQLLVEIRQWLDVNGTTTLYWYVLESSTLTGVYTVISETIVNETGVGQDMYSSGPISVTLQAGMFYGIGAAWGPETVGYFRDPATLPRDWELGTVEDCMQISAPPPYTNLEYNHYPGAEYMMELCFEMGTPVEGPTWGAIKDTFR